MQSWHKWWRAATWQWLKRYHTLCTVCALIAQSRTHCWACTCGPETGLLDCNAKNTKISTHQTKSWFGATAPKVDARKVSWLHIAFFQPEFRSHTFLFSSHCASNLECTLWMVAHNHWVKTIRRRHLSVEEKAFSALVPQSLFLSLLYSCWGTFFFLLDWKTDIVRIAHFDHKSTVASSCLTARLALMPTTTPTCQPAICQGSRHSNPKCSIASRRSSKRWSPAARPRLDMCSRPTATPRVLAATTQALVVPAV